MSCARRPSAASRWARRATTPSSSAPRTSSSTCSRTAARPPCHRSSVRRWSSGTRPAGSRSFFRLEQVVRETFGYRYLIPSHQGRGAEHLLALASSRPGTIVPSNLYFTTSREHVELAGRYLGGRGDRRGRGPGVDVPVQGEHRPRPPGGGARRSRARRGRPRPPGGVLTGRWPPFSIENLAAVRELTPPLPRPLSLTQRASPRTPCSSRSARARTTARVHGADPPHRRPRRRRALLSKKDHFVPIGGLSR